MRCPECDSSESKVLETRVSKNSEMIRRRRECLACACRFTTQEEILRNEFVVIKSDGKREELNLQKIRNGLELACHKRPVLQEQIDDVMKAIKKDLERSYEREIPTAEIGRLLMDALKELDEVAYVRFTSVYRQFKDAAEFVEEIKQLYTKPSS